MEGGKKRKKKNTEVLNELKITPVTEKINGHKSNWANHVNIISHNRLPGILKKKMPNGRKNPAIPKKRLMDIRNGAGTGLSMEAT